MPHSNIHPKTRIRSKELRRELTYAEARMWNLLRDFRSRGARFRRETPIGPYIADFAWLSARIVVEVDGDSHELGDGPAKDARRDAFLREQGFTILRFDNRDVIEAEDAVFIEIESAIVPFPAPGAFPMLSLPSTPHYTGGCQCGAVRFRVEGALGDASVCHCRMCQKAFGSFYAPLVSVRSAKLTWTRGQPKRFQSSNHVRRGFCADCGTPLTYEAPDGAALAIGAFDEPEEIAPAMQWGTEAKLPYVDGVSDLPGHHTLDDAGAAGFLNDLVSYQHPDHDTDDWPPKDRK